MLKLNQIINQIIEYSFYLLFFFVPLVMTPFNYELFEFNKMFLVYLTTAVIVAAWLVKMVVQKKIIFQRTFMDIPFLLFLVSQLLSFHFSIDRHTSFWGYYSRSHGGLLSTISYLLLYWAFVGNYSGISRSGRVTFFKKFTQKLTKSNFLTNCLLAIFGSAILVSAYGIAERFGIDAQYWVQDVQNRVFSTLGQPNWLAAFLVAIIPLSWIPVLKEKSQNNKLPVISNGLFSVLFVCLLFTKSRSGLLGFTASYLIFWGLTLMPLLRKKLTKKTLVLRKNFFIISGLALMICFLVGTPWTPSIKEILSRPAPAETPTPVGISESGDIRKVVWRGAIGVWKHYPWFGSGNETFAYSYYQFRPREHNDLSEWDFLYNKAHNEYLNLVATTGTFGLLAYLGMVVVFLGWSLKKLKAHDQNSYLILALTSGFISILVTNFFGFSVVIIGVFFFLFPALAWTANQKPKPDRPVKLQKKVAFSLWQYAGLGAVLIFLLFTFYSLLTYWYADAVFAKGDKLAAAGQHQDALDYFNRAVTLRPSESLYHNGLAITSANLAQTAIVKNEIKLASELAELAIRESDLTMRLNPNHLNYWKNRVRVFYALTDLDENYYQKVLESLLIAAKLAPTDAKIFYNLGLVYNQTDQNPLAIETLEKAVQLKPNYTDARFALALLYDQTGETGKAKKQLEYILEKINPQHEPAQEKLDQI
jgi:O-antigen ligase